MDIYGLKEFTPIFTIVLIPKNLLTKCSPGVSHYDRQLVQKDHNGNKRNHFLFLCYPWHWLASHCNLCFLNVYFMCTFNITLCCFIQMLICDTDINQSTTISEQTAAEVTWGKGVNFFYWSHICKRFCYCQTLSNISA